MNEFFLHKSKTDRYKLPERHNPFIMEVNAIKIEQIRKMPSSVPRTPALYEVTVTMSVNGISAARRNDIWVGDDGMYYMCQNGVPLIFDVVVPLSSIRNLFNMKMISLTAVTFDDK